MIGTNEIRWGKLIYSLNIMYRTINSLANRDHLGKQEFKG
jgi:hypothetical protein